MTLVRISLKEMDAEMRQLASQKMVGGGRSLAEMAKRLSTLEKVSPANLTMMDMARLVKSGGIRKREDRRTQALRDLLRG